jgi:two-component sensor histidine kinase
LCNEISKGAAFALVVEEALLTDELAVLAKCLEAQPAWSDFPIVLLTGHGDAPGRAAFAARLQKALGNVTFVERPFHPTTLISVARSAVQSRRRQYQARELLERRDLLTRELQHRTKNMLAVIRAIASASLPKGKGRETFLDRLQALANAQDLIIEGTGRGALMTEVVRSALGSFGTRVSVDGPEVYLSSNAAQGFALIMHELATNAAKHGSLTSETGTVSARWSVDTSAQEPRIIFQWRERGGPPVSPPKRKGFGSLILERALSTAVAPPQFEYSREGFTYEVSATLAQ